MADAFGMQKADILEASLSNPDVGGIDVRRDFPFSLPFWRAFAGLAEHRDPIFHRLTDTSLVLKGSLR